MNWWDEKAGNLQASVRDAERNMYGKNMYDDEQVRAAVMHAREDVVMIVSHLSSLNRQVRTVKWLLAVIAVLALLTFLR
jgi:hypothetical protein